MLSLKKWLTVSMVFAVLLVGAMPAFAQGPNDVPNTITVSGIGSAEVAPNMVTVEIGVDVFNPDVRSAFSESNATLRQIVTALRELGIGDNDINTSNLSVYSSSRYSPMGEEERGFNVNNTVRITVRDITLIETVLDTAIGAGANQIYGLSFGVSNTQTVESAARAEALNNARDRAQELATLSGVTLGDVISIREIVGDVGVFPIYRGVGMGGGADSAYVEPGQQSFSVQVQVTYRIVR